MNSWHILAPLTALFGLACLAAGLYGTRHASWPRRRYGPSRLRISPLWDRTPDELRIAGIARARQAEREARDRVLEDEWRRRVSTRIALKRAQRYLKGAR